MRAYPEDLAGLLGEDGSALSPAGLSGAESLPAVVAAPVGRGVDLALGGAYEGADRFDQSVALWQPSLRSADMDMLPEKPVIDARSRDTVRNDAYVAGGAEIHKDSIVGARFMLNARPQSRVLFGKQDDVWEREAQEEIELKFGLYAESDDKWIDRQRTKSLTDIVRLNVGSFVPSGEVLMSSEWMPKDGRPFRSAFQCIDADRLSTPHDQNWNAKIRGGVECDKGGAPIAYHIRNAHASDWMNAGCYQWTRVMGRKPWGRKMILHIYDQVRPAQTRGISAMVAALSEMKMLKGFRRVELQRAIVAATYAASIESELPPSEAFRALGEGEIGSAVGTYAEQYLASVAAYSGNSNGLKIDGVKIPHLFPGTKLHIQSAGIDSPMGDKFEQSALRYLAAILGVSYEQLSKDYSQTNYSSARAGFGEAEKAMSSRKRKVADGSANFMYRNWLEEVVNDNSLECLKRRNVPNFYEGLNADAYANAAWIGAGKPQIDKLKETQADILSVKAGFETKEDIIARRGGEWRYVGKQQAREYENDKANGVPSIYDMDTTSQTNAANASDGEARGKAKAAA